MRTRSPRPPARLLLALLVVMVSLQEASAFFGFRHRWLVPNLYFPMIRALDRKATTARKVFGGLSRIFAMLGRRRRSLDSPAADLCDLQQPCLALQAMDAGELDQWVADRWPAAADGLETEPQLAQLFGQLSQLQREERPYSRQLRRRACRAVLQRCPAS